ncbi:DUF2975 domain-containing protein [Nocardioides sp. Y6]|uniref:DUF2975 domain-containing protein n=1 Tax=Nocardioides malaquae TaxID=2773426 RepID=A0ABR9RUQ8_9ACTN|nr:DUF2975 domain-containing protein [Nocardioides malaquae]MBE7325316.1 DUF2975 domain-containing protein [Nocardioides malaquae]
MTDATRLDRLLTFDPRDFQVARFALALSALAVALVTVARPLWQWLRDEPLEGGITVDAAATQVAAREGAEVAWSGDVLVTLASPTTTDRLAALAPGLALSLTAALLAWLGIRLLTAIASGEPFTRRSVNALRGIAATLLAAMLVVPATDAVLQAQLATSGLADSNDAVFVLEPFLLLLVGTVALVVASVAEAFARGARLADDVDGLV